MQVEKWHTADSARGREAPRQGEVLCRISSRYALILLWGRPARGGSAKLK